MTTLERLARAQRWAKARARQRGLSRKNTARLQRFASEETRRSTDDLLVTKEIDDEALKLAGKRQTNVIEIARYVAALAADELNRTPPEAA